MASFKTQVLNTYFIIFYEIFLNINTPVYLYIKYKTNEKLYLIAIQGHVINNIQH